MRDGDLSSDLAPPVAFRFERLIKTDEGKLNKNIKSYIQALMGRLDVNVYVITTGDERKATLFMWKWGIPYTRIYKADTTFEIPDIVNENDVLTYYDVDTDRVQDVNARAKKGVKAIQWTHRVVL